MGWALKSSESRRIRFTQNQKSYLTAKFRLGEETGNKADPAAVARSMMCAKDSTGNMLFKSDEFLTANQIAGFFSRLASKKTLVDDEQQGDIEVAAHEAGLEEPVSDAVRELAPKHPVVYDAYNLCELASQRFGCSSFDIDEGLPGVLGNKGTFAKYRREQGNINQFLGTGEQNFENYSTKTFWESVGTWEHRAILEGNKGTRTPPGRPSLTFRM